MRAHGTRYSRNGLRTVSPLASLMTRGRSAQAYMKPVTTSSAPVISSENQSRDWMTRSSRLATANTTQAHHKMSGPVSRNVVRPCSSVFQTGLVPAAGGVDIRPAYVQSIGAAGLGQG